MLPFQHVAMQQHEGKQTIRRASAMQLTIETEQEVDGRWLAEVPQLPGVLAYGTTEDDATAKVEALALRVMAERLENSEAKPLDISIAITAR